MPYYEEDIELMNKAALDYDQMVLHNKEMLDSMYYASFVQKGILPQERHFKRTFTDSFVMYKPQRIIGGDMYWLCQKGDYKVFAVGDCTGHGVSGAMLSVLAVSFLNYLILGKDVKGLGHVLEEMDKKWIETFHQGIELGFNNDWMEIGLAAFHAPSRKLLFAGAFNKAVCISEKEEIILDGNRYPIGGWQLEAQRPFAEQEIILPQESMVYLFSDGYKDQFGSNTKRRYGSARFMNLLRAVAPLPTEKQQIRMEEDLLLWQGAEQQTDDICILGVRL